MKKMYKDVIIRAFEKAAQEIIGKSTKTQRSSYISNVLEENYRYFVNERTLRNLYDDARAAEQNIDIAVKTEHISQLCKFLGYQEYLDFEEANKIQVKQKRIYPSSKLWLPLFLILSLALWFSYNTIFSTASCMKWNDIRYEKTDCSGRIEEIPYNKTIFENMRALEACDTTTFFRNGKPIVWYDKSNGEISFFSHYGLHPENGKTLKPISEYIINKYVNSCK
jgi:hypothetical protein